MDLALSPQDQAFRDEVRRFLDDNLSEDLREAGRKTGGVFADIAAGLRWHKVLASRGWSAPTWPKEHGGTGWNATERYIFARECAAVDAPRIFSMGLRMVGPVIMKYGTPEQKAKYLPPIVAGDIVFCQGYSEPGSGSDLASLKTRAVRDGDDYVINGNKIFTSGAEYADYIWLAARTDPNAPKHKGITMFIVPATAKGFSASPIHTLGGGATAMSYYENVRVPEENVVGGVNGGWKLITTQLNHERVGLAAFGSACFSRAEKVIDWARSTETSDGGKMIDLPWVQHNLAEVFARIEAMKLLNWRMAAALESGFVNPADASAVKVYGTEVVLEVYRLLQEIVGPASLVEGGSPGAQADGEIEVEARMGTINTFGGGVNEIQREIVAMAGLRMPRVPR